MVSMMHGTYVGPLAHLKGKGALLRPLTRLLVLAQFDDVRAAREPGLLQVCPQLIWGLSLGYGWHTFAVGDFSMLSSWCFAVQQSDAMVCRQCDLGWDMNDPAPPECKRNGVRDCPTDEFLAGIRRRHGN